jgi:hypothetical protein
VKTKFLDVRNCHALLPNIPNFPLIKKLDECLEKVNNTPGKIYGFIDSLIRHNQKTSSTKKGSSRLCKSPIDFAQIVDFKIGQLQTTSRPSLDLPYAVFHLLMQYENGINWKVMIPIQFLLKGWGDANKEHQGYIHVISQNMNKIKSLNDWKAHREHDSDEFYYVGITSRNWLLRLSEHIAEMNRGSRRQFYRAWRESLGLENVAFLSVLQEVNLSYEEVMNWEERKVDRIANDAQGLNMIPGGFKGLRQLHKLRIISETNISPEDRDAALERYMREHPRKGIPNPFITELWKDDEFYLKVLAGSAKKLSPEQVRKIRELGKSGIPAAEIVDEVDALNILQVKRVLAGSTYNRIK